jgi:hypothetical protein
MTARGVLGGRRCVVCRQIERSQDAGAATAVPVVCRSSAGRRQADGSRSNVVTGVVDSGREIGHGNIDANDPERTSHFRFHSRGQRRKKLRNRYTKTAMTATGTLRVTATARRTRCGGLDLPSGHPQFASNNRIRAPLARTPKSSRPISRCRITFLAPGARIGDIRARRF